LARRGSAQAGAAPWFQCGSRNALERWHIRFAAPVALADLEKLSRKCWFRPPRDSASDGRL
jgi:hypothetical protein